MKLCTSAELCVLSCAPERLDLNQANVYIQYYAKSHHLEYGCSYFDCCELSQCLMIFVLLQVGLAVEEAMGSAQDIEGVVKNGEVYVVQTRPQV